MSGFFSVKRRPENFFLIEANHLAISMKTRVLAESRQRNRLVAGEAAAEDVVDQQK